MPIFVDPTGLNGVRFFLVVGGLGAFTTFSTFAFELLQLLTSGDVTDVLFYGAVQILGGLAFVPSVCGLLNSYVRKCILAAIVHMI